MAMFLGVAYGEIETVQGVLCLSDARTGVALPLITAEQAIARQIASADGERVKLTFEVCDLTSLGYVIPRQIERCPEEYKKPQMETFIFTDQHKDCGLKPASYTQEAGPRVVGHLMRHYMQPQGQRTQPHEFQLEPLDFAVLMGRIAGGEFMDSQLGWMRCMALRARIEISYQVEDVTGFRILEILQIQTIEEWEQDPSKSGKQAALPAVEDSIEEPSEPSADEPGSTGGRSKRRPISTRLRYEILRRDGHRCVDCGASACDDPFVRLEIDHRVPVSRGGSNEPENLQTLCWACNNGKSDQVDHKLTQQAPAPDPWAVACLSKQVS